MGGSDGDRGRRARLNTTVSFATNVGSRFVTFFGYIVLANVGGSAVLGIFYLFESVYILSNRVCSLGLGQAVVKRISEESDVPPEDQILGVGLAIRAVLSTGVLVVLFAFRRHLDGYVGMDGIWLALWVILSLSLLYSTYRAVLVGNKRIAYASLLDVGREALVILLQVALVLVGFEAMGMVGGFGLGIATSLVAVLASARVRPALPTREDIQSVLEFAWYSYLDSFVGGRRRWIDVLVLGFFVSDSVVGVYGIVYMLARVGITLSAAIGQTLFPEISSAAHTQDDGTVSRLVNQSMRYSTLVSVPLVFGAFAVGEWLLRVVYNFQTGYTALVILSVGMLFYSVYQPLHQSIYGLNRPGISFRLSAVGAVANLLLALALIPWLGIVGAAVGTSISQAVVMVGGIYILARSNSVDLDLSTRPWIIQVVSSVAMTGALFALRITIESYTVFTLALVILASGLLYVTCVVMLDETVRHQLRDLRPVL